MSVSFWYHCCFRYQASCNLDVRVDMEGLARAGQAEWKEKGIPGRGNSLWKGPELNGHGVSKGMKGGQHSEEGALKTSI